MCNCCSALQSFAHTWRSGFVFFLFLNREKLDLTSIIAFLEIRTLSLKQFPIHTKSVCVYNACFDYECFFPSALDSLIHSFDGCLDSSLCLGYVFIRSYIIRIPLRKNPSITIAMANILLSDTSFSLCYSSRVFFICVTHFVLSLAAFSLVISFFFIYNCESIVNVFNSSSLYLCGASRHRACTNKKKGHKSTPMKWTSPSVVWTEITEWEEEISGIVIDGKTVPFKFVGEVTCVFFSQRRHSIHTITF